MAHWDDISVNRFTLEKNTWKQPADLVLPLMQETSCKYIFPTVFQLTSDKQKLIVSYK